MRVMYLYTSFGVSMRYPAFPTYESRMERARSQRIGQLYMLIEQLEKKVHRGGSFQLQLNAARQEMNRLIRQP
ncbi:MAG TPA: hypothetical protein VFM18_17360 [Methanosarcina sp.]|nr:hypothetical protein [Methanosarcina sp.]